jgi:aryl carrier-like protein
LVDESARRLGDSITISDFSGPIHTNFPLLILVEPESNWRLSLIYDLRELPPSVVGRWGQDLVDSLTCFSEGIEVKLAAVLERLSQPVKVAPFKRRLRVASQNYVPPQTELERSFAQVWEEMLQLDQISVEENLFDLGAHSMLVTRLHQRLRETVGQEFPLVTLFEYPTIQSLAKHLGQNAEQKFDGNIRNRARLHHETIARLKSKNRSNP